MDIAFGVFGYSWLEVVVFLLVIVVIIFLRSIEVVYFSQQKYYPNRPRRLEEEEIPSDFQELSKRYENKIIELGFYPFGTYDCSSTDNVEMPIQFYVSTDMNHMAAIMGPRSLGKMQKCVLEFCTTLLPAGEICTNNHNCPNVLYHPKEKCIVKLPWVDDISILYDYHQAFCQAIEYLSFRPVENSSEDIERNIEEDFVRSYELQVEKGRMKKTIDGGYQITLWGAIIAAPLVLMSKIYVFLLKINKPNKEALVKKVRARYQLALERREWLGKK
ncbi:MAG: hypothetical protein JXD22_15190 [Sedimentisphaerales bacterium]|nr:hypothetical protein [Sedimentisphaerales bacterium]